MNIDFDELHVFDKSLGKHVPIETLEKAQAESDRRLALLRRQNIIRVSQGRRCILCGAKPKLVESPGSNYEWVYEDSHADDCELAEETGGQHG